MNINIYNPYVRQELELYHHGVAGQKWGKKNGPPYPLSASAHSASEKKAGWRKSLSGGASAAGRGAVKAAKAAGRGAVKAAKAAGRGAVKATKATGRGAVKATKATGRFVKKAAHLANRGLLAIDKKPKFLMTSKEVEERVERLKLNKKYKRALKGKFVDVVEAEKNKGQSVFKTTMGAIGKDVALPLLTGTLNYQIAKRLGAGDGTEIDIVSTIMGNRATKKKNNNNGNQNGGNNNNNGNQNGGNNNNNGNQNGGNNNNNGNQNGGNNNNNGNQNGGNNNNNGNQNGGNGNNNGNQNGGNGNRRQNRNGGNSDSSSDSTPSPRPTPDPTPDPSPRSDSHPLRDRINNLNERANSTPDSAFVRSSSQERHELYSNIWSTVRPFRQNQATRETLSTRVSNLNSRMTSYGDRLAREVISEHGGQSFSSFVNRLSRVDDIRHSAIEEKYAKYMKLKI